jgi:Fic family protein
MERGPGQPGVPGRIVPTAFDQGDGAGGSVRVQGRAFVPDALPPRALEADRDRVISRLYPLLEQATSRLARLEQATENLPDPHVILGAMRMREAQASSRIENTVASIEDVTLAALGSPSAPGEAVEVHRNRLAIEHGLTSPLPISSRLVREMHAVLVRDPRHRPGEFRDRQVYIGDEPRGFAGARFVPPPPSEVEAAMSAWELYVNPDVPGAPQRLRLPALIELGLAHYQFETIHPFSDGNGRLGRALVNLGPIKAGWLRRPVCNLSEWVQSHRQEYYDRLLAVSTEGDWQGWLEYFVRAVGGQAQLDLARVERIRGLRERYREMLTQKKSSTLTQRLVDALFRQPVISIPKAAELLNVRHPSATKHVEALVKLGVLKQATPGNYSKIYVAPGIIQAIHGPEGD